MKTVLYILSLTLLFSCGKDKVVQLPEINHSEITEINDVSAAYLFYDETKLHGVELNRRNLISTTNWLINVDKRLTLKQAIPHIKFLQEKKRNSSHKNKNAKNYFTCNDTSKKNLGFIEFTDVVYHNELSDLYERKGIISSKPKLEALIRVLTLDSIRIDFTSKTNNVTTTQYSNQSNIFDDLSDISRNRNLLFFLAFDKTLLFQDYISIKSSIHELNTSSKIISNNEFLLD